MFQWTCHKLEPCAIALNMNNDTVFSQRKEIADYKIK